MAARRTGMARRLEVENLTHLHQVFDFKTSSVSATHGRVAASGAANCRHATRQRRRTGHSPHHRNLARREASAATHAPMSKGTRRRRFGGGLPEIAYGGWNNNAYTRTRLRLKRCA